MAEPTDYTTASRKNFVTNDNEGRMIEKCIIEIQGAFLVKIRNYAFNGNIGENAFKHIDKFLEIVRPIKINGLTQDRFRLSSITTWDNMVEKFILKFHHLSDHNEEEETEEDDNPNEMDNVPEIFKIEGNLFDFKTPLCEAFDKFNCLLKIDTDMFTYDIQNFKTYDEYKLELNNDKAKGTEKLWSENGVPYQLCDHICETYRFKNGGTKWPTCTFEINGGELPGMDLAKTMIWNRDVIGLYMSIPSLRPYVAKALGTQLDLSTTYHPQTDGQSEHTIQTLEGMLRACGIAFGSSWDTHLPLAESLVLWVEIRESQLIGPELVQEISDKGEVFGGCKLHAPLGEVKIGKTLRFVEEPIEIMDRKVKKLKRSRIPIVKVRWNSKREPKFT
ncbi:hypothetical protein Tco_0943696 [Tanacetum coccineum]